MRLHYRSIVLLVFLVVPLLVLGGVRQAPGQTEHWQTTCVDCPWWFQNLTDRTLRLDTEDHAHVAFGSDHLYYAFHDGTTWHYETVDDAPKVGAFASLDLDQAGQPHIGYYDEFNKDLKYAYRNGSGWYLETVDGAGDVGQLASLAMDKDSHPHITYYGAGSMKYAHRDAAGWHLETVSAAGWLCNSLEVDSAGWPHLAYLGPFGYLQYARRDSGGWHLEVLKDKARNTCSLALDHDDFPVIVYGLIYDSELVRWTGASWSYGGSMGSSTGMSLVLDSDGYPHVSGTFEVPDEPPYPELHYDYQDASGWHRRSLNAGEALGQTSLALDANGSPVFTYQGSTSLRLMRHEADEWRHELVAESQDVGRTSSLAIGSDGRPRAAYSGRSISVYYAEEADAEWIIERWGGYRQSGAIRGISLALDTGNQPHLAYALFWSAWSGDVSGLCYRYRHADGWQYQPIYWSAYGQPSRYMYPSIALDAGDVPLISYLVRYDSSVPDLRSIRRAETAWTGLGGDEDVTEHRSMALDSGGNPVIGYIADLDLVKVAFYDSIGWHYEIVDAAGGSGVFLDLDSQDFPHLSYRDSEGDLKYAQRTVNGWRLETVDTGDFQETSLVVDRSDAPHISYYDATNQSLKYAFRDAAGWHTEVVDDSGERGLGSSIAVDSQGTIHMTYYDAVNRDLLLAARAPGPLPTPTPLAHYRYLPVIINR